MTKRQQQTLVARAQAQVLAAEAELGRALRESWSPIRTQDARCDLARAQADLERARGGLPTILWGFARQTELAELAAALEVTR